MMKVKGGALAAALLISAVTDETPRNRELARTGDLMEAKRALEIACGVAKNRTNRPPDPKRRDKRKRARQSRKANR